MPYVGRVPSAVPVTADDIPANSIDASKIIDGSIELAEIADNSITDAKLNSSKLDGIETGATNYIHPTTHATADIADNAITDAKIADAAVVSLKSGRKNLIINGGFDVWQRGTSTTTGFFADRFQGNHSGHTTTKSTDVPTGKGFGSSAQFVGTGSDPYFYQNVEGSAAVAGRVATFSFWIKGGLGQCYIYDGSYHPVSTTLIETVGSWTRRSITYTFATGSYNPLVRIGLPTNTSNTCHTTGWQLELGSVATDFEHRSFGEELALCKRYYQKSFAYSTTPANGANSSGFSTEAGLVYSQASHNNSNRDYYHFEVEMRTTPSLTMYGNSSGYWHSPTSNWHVYNKVTNSVSSKGFGFRQQASGGVIPVRGHYAATAEI